VMNGVVKEDESDERSFQHTGIPEDDAWLISRILFFWQNSLFTRASVLFKRQEALEQEDLLPLPPRDHGQVNFQKFDEAWDNQDALNGGSGKKLSNDEDIKAGSPKLRKALKHILGWPFIVAGIVKFVNTSLQFGFPLLLNAILKFIEDYQKGLILETDPWHVRYRGYWLAATLFVAMGCKALTENNYFHIVNRGSFQVKSAISVAVYNKSLKLSNVERQSTNLGELVNLMQVDASKIEVFIPQIHVLWDGIFQIIGYMSILYTLIGPSCFAGLLVMILAAPVQAVVMKKLFGMNRLMVKHTDARVESINEALQGIQGVKMYTWEEKVSKRIEQYRNEELKQLKSAAYLTGFSRAYMGALPGVVAVVSFLVYSLTEDADISASILFASIVAFDQLRFPLMFYPMALAQLVQAQVSAARLEIFLGMGEIAGETGKGTYTRERCSKGGVAIKDAEIYWSDPEVPLDSSKTNNSESGADDSTVQSLGASSDDEASVSTATNDNEKQLSDDENVLHYPKAALKNLNLTIENGELCAVVGRVASGKSTLCSAVLNETFLAKGEITLQGEVAYAAQSPWILNATVRENILFGKPMDEDRYNRVIQACQLEHDLTLLEDGDLTDIGEKGINLSGGQKARVSVARAAYSDADIIILDDPLSALDPEVAAALFNECITGDLMSGKTRLLVTNQLQFLSQCDHVVVLRKGEVMEDGTATELLANKESEMNRLLAKLSGKSSNKVVKEESAKEDKSTGDGKSTIATSKKNKLLTKEERNVGAVAASVYLKYIKAGGGYVRFAFVYVAYVFTAANSAASVAWVSFWTADPNYQSHSKEFYLGMYFLLAVTLGIFTFMRSYLLAYFGVKASERLHNNLLKSILRAPMSFFDTTPIGRILSRFSKDVYSVDLELDNSIDFVIFCTLTIVVSLLSIIVVTPWFGVAVIPLGFIYFQYLQYFRAVSRETKRLDSISRSPVYAQFSETLGGLSTIRAYGEPDRFKNEFEGKVNTNTQALYNNKSAERWISTRLELLGSAIAGITAVLAVNLVISNSGGGIGGGAPVASLAGLSLTYAISVTSLLQWTVRTFSNMENAMNATERMLFYTEETPEEAPFTSSEYFSDKTRFSRDSENRKPYTVAAASAGGKSETVSSDWPQTGSIEIKNLYMKYRKGTPMVLKGLNVDIKGGERVGVVGRTGSGKSSLLLSLLRLVEPNLDETSGGYTSPITIDGIDILRVGLRDLRSKLGIIPQNPMLFSGTIKSNLDPFDEYTAEEIWKALEQCGMKGSVEEMPGHLEATVAEGGQNLSNGMRQMLVLGRALLRQCKILFLDEATASVDIETDREIQRTLREAFKGCTVLTIAHRINTIMDSDKILVLKDGRAEEFAAPEELLKDETSIFSEIVRHAQAEGGDEQ